jgi:nitrate reductase gamma subunit
MHAARGGPTWQAPGKFGYAEAVQSAGTIVAPLLAGFTIAMIGLVVDTSNKGVRHRDLALLVLTAAASALLAAIQCAYSARQYLATPDQFQSWYPDLETAEPYEEDAGKGLSRPVQTWWAARSEQAAHTALHARWAKRFRVLYHVGVVLVLCGLAVTLIPPGHVSATRCVAVGLASLAALAEALWVAATGLVLLVDTDEDPEALGEKQPWRRRALWRVSHFPAIQAAITWAVPPYTPARLPGDPRGS